MLYGWFSCRICNVLLMGITIRAPHGGVFVVFAMNKVIPFFICLIVAGAVSAALIVLVSKTKTEQELAED